MIYHILLTWKVAGLPRKSEIFSQWQQMKQFSLDANLKGLCPHVIARTARLYSIIVFANEVKQSSNYTFIKEHILAGLPRKVVFHFARHKRLNGRKLLVSSLSTWLARSSQWQWMKKIYQAQTERDFVPLQWQLSIKF